MAVSDEAKTEAVRLVVEEGRTQKDIAAEFGVTPGAVSQWIRKRTREPNRRCQQCDTPFYADQSTDERFCSRECWWEHKSLDPIPCAGCGKTFQPSGRDSQYCTRECYRAAQNAKEKRPKQRTCPTCGASFVPTGRLVVYCSPGCFHANARPVRIARRRSRSPR